MSKHYQLLIIGGSVAGSAAAIHARQKDLSVAIIERENFPRDRPGETLHPGVEPLLKQLGVLEAVKKVSFTRHKGTYIQWNAAPEFQPFNTTNSGEDWYGFQAHRRVFDQLLLEQAKKLGAEVWMGMGADKPIVENQRVVGAVLNGEEIRADYVIDASGHWHWLSRQLHLPVNYFSKQLIARYGYAQGSCPIRDEAPAIIADKEGWTWTAKIAKDLYQWTRLDLFSTKKTHFWPEEFKNLIPLGGSKGADVTWRFVEQPAGPGFFIVGDAVAVLDPASSHGVLRALMSGIQAADLIGHIVNKRCPDNVATQHYHDWLWEWFFHDLQRLSLLYKKLECFS